MQGAQQRDGGDERIAGPRLVGKPRRPQLRQRGGNRGTEQDHQP